MSPQGTSPYSHFFQGGYTFLDGRVSAEELVHRALYILEGIDDVEMGGCLVGRLQRLLIRGQLFQG